MTENSLTGLSKARRLRTASLESQPWHASTTDFVPHVITKREQMQATPARGEPDKLAIDARKTSFEEIYLPFRTAQAERGSLSLPEMRRPQYLRMDLSVA